MERNVYGALLGVSILGLILNFEWLFLTFILLAVGLFLADHFASPPAPSFDGTFLPGPEVSGQYSPPQQPIVIQSATQSPSSNMMMDMISNLVQESATYNRPKSPWKKMTGQMEGISGKINKMEKILKKMEKEAKDSKKGDKAKH